MNKEKETYAFIDSQNLNIGVRSHGWKLDWRKFHLYLHNRYGRERSGQCLMQEGIQKENIEIMDVCTKCSKDLYSYRGGDVNGRFVSVIGLL